MLSPLCDRYRIQHFVESQLWCRDRWIIKGILDALLSATSITNIILCGDIWCLSQDLLKNTPGAPVTIDIPIVLQDFSKLFSSLSPNLPSMPRILMKRSSETHLLAISDECDRQKKFSRASSTPFRRRGYSLRFCVLSCMFLLSLPDGAMR